MTMLSRETGFGRDASNGRGVRPSGGTAIQEAAHHARLGTELYRRGLYARAAQEFRWALDADPANADVHNQLAIALNAQGQYEEAVGELRQALAISPTHAEAASNLARVLRAVGMDETALAVPPRQGSLPN